MSKTDSSIRTPLAQVRGLGSAREGTHHWWLQRVTAVALIPLSIWLLANLLSLSLGDVAEVKTWLQQPFQALFLALFLGTTCYHGKLGIQVIVEDYVHTPLNKNLLLVLNSFGFVVLFAMALLAIVKLHFA